MTREMLLQVYSRWVFMPIASFLTLDRVQGVNLAYARFWNLEH